MRRAASPAAVAVAGWALLPLLLACAQQVPVSADLAARIETRDVPYARFEEFVRQQVGEGAGGLHSEVLSQLFDQFLGEELLAMLAVDEGLAPAGASPRQAADALLAADAGEPTAEEVAAWYEQHRGELMLPERVVLRQILVGDGTVAEAARRRIERGEPFAEVARELSRDPSAAVGGLQGEIAFEDLPAAFATQVGTLAPGQVGEPIEATDGWHLFQVDSRLPARPQALEEVAVEIAERLRGERSDTVLARRMAEAADRYDVAVYAQNLPFEYRGRYAPGGGGAGG